MYKETPAGLNHPDCVLQDVQIQADIYETLAKISTTHRYFNHGTANIEAVYTFPLPNSAVLLDMSLTIGDRSMTGQILPKNRRKITMRMPWWKATCQPCSRIHRPEYTP